MLLLAVIFLCSAVCGSNGFWCTRKDVAGRWWAVAPDGRETVLAGVDHVSFIGHPCEKTGVRRYLETNRRKYGTKEKWSAAAGKRLSDWGFSLLGAGCDPSLRGNGRAYTIHLDISRELTSGEAIRAIRPNPHDNPCEGFPDVFDPAWEETCRRVARERCAPIKSDSNLFGYFVDNELAWWGHAKGFDSVSGLFDCVAKLPPDRAARKALDAFLAERRKNGIPHAEDKAEFLRLAAERYFSVATAAIRAADPNHLVLGCRFAGLTGANRIVWETAGKFCDVVTFNSYPWADIDSNVLFAGTSMRNSRFVDVVAERAAWTERPLMVTEWSFPAIDAGMPCMHGAGQRMRTQAERTRATELCLRTFLSVPSIVCYSYFMWVDEPALGISKALPEDSNYGLVSENDEPYPLVGAFERVHPDIVRLHRSPPPLERPLPPPSGDELAKGAFAAYGYVGPAGVEFVRNGDAYRLSNRVGFSLEGRIGGQRMFDSVTLHGKEIGSYGAMLHYADGKRLRWEDTSRTESVRWDAATGRLLVRASCGKAFAVTHAFTLHPDKPLVLAECVELANAGSKVLDVKAFYFRQFAPYAGEANPSCTDHPDLWKAPRSDGWLAADGRFWGGETRARGVTEFLYYMAADGAHPDAAIAPPGGRLVLPPGGVWHSPEGWIWMICRATTLPWKNEN